MSRSNRSQRAGRSSALLLWGSMLLACSPGALPDPVIEGITPNEILSTSSGSLILQLDAVLPHEVDYGAGEVRLDSAVTVFLGEQELGTSRMDEAGRAVLPYSSRFAPGVYDVRIRLADGRDATLAAALTVQPGLFPTGYTLDYIDTQRQDRNFRITIRAQGAGAAEFAGTVNLSVSDGTLRPEISGPFTAGVREERVRIREARGSTVTVTVADVEGNSGTSNPFLIQ